MEEKEHNSKGQATSQNGSNEPPLNNAAEPVGAPQYHDWRTERYGAIETISTVKAVDGRDIFARPGFTYGELFTWDGGPQ
jgi:hypothetical protein